MKTPEMYLIEKPYEIKDLTLGKEDIDKLVRPEWHRDFRQQHVQSIIKSLKEGQHFSEPITLNFIGGKYRIINGNHRIAAVKEIIKQFPAFKIECTVIGYKDLTLEEERKLYTKINHVRPETSDDNIKAYCIDSFIFTRMQERDFPVNVGFYHVTKTSRDYIHFTSLMRPYIMRKKHNIITGLTKQSIIDEIRKLEELDYNRIKRFVAFFKRIFGEPGHGNVYSEYHKITVLAKIFYFESVGQLGEENLEKRFREVIVRYPATFNDKVASFDAQAEFYHTLIRQLNSVRTFGKGIYVTDQLNEAEKIRRGHENE
jgi:hypothetical protein